MGVLDWLASVPSLVPRLISQAFIACSMKSSPLFIYTASDKSLGMRLLKCSLVPRLNLPGFYRFPAFHTASDKGLGDKPGNEAR